MRNSPRGPRGKPPWKLNGRPLATPAMPPAKLGSEKADRASIDTRTAVPPEGLGSRLNQIIAWLDTNCGADGGTSTPSSFAFGETAHGASTRGVANDALAITFADATL